MIDRALIATRDRDLYEQLQRDLVVPESDDPLCKAVDPRFKTVAEVRRRANAAGLIIIHASTPADDEATDGESGKAVLSFMRELREGRSTIPIIVLLPHPMEEIESYCAKSELDYDLNIAILDHDTLKNAFRRLGLLANGQSPHDYTIEIDVQSHCSKVELLEDGKSMRQKPNLNPKPSRMRMYADEFQKWRMLQRVEESRGPCMRPSPGWLPMFRMAGEVLYDDLLRSVLSDDLESIQRKPGGLMRLYLRFHVANDLFAVPFEALYDSVASRFLCIVAPIVRRLSAESPIRAANDQPSARDLNVLFVKAQVEGYLRLIDDTDRMVVEKQWFEHLENLDVEEKYFREADGRFSKNRRVSVKFLTQPDGGRTFAETLKNELAERRYEIVHFAGHSFVAADGQTFLILPSPAPDRVIGLPIQSFARWAGGAGVSFAYLSSCRGGSWEGVRNLVEHGVPQVLGFRWDVEDDKAARFARVFYGNLLDHGGCFAAAYRDACEELHNESNSTNPIWASPVMIMQNDNWWTRAA